MYTWMDGWMDISSYIISGIIYRQDSMIFK